MKNVVCIDGRRECYSPEQMDGTMTVGELISYLNNYFNPDDLVMINNDNGYTYGSITESSFTTERLNDLAQFEAYMDIELEDDGTEYGGIEFAGETLRDFLTGLDESDRPVDVKELNELLVECGIKPINI